MSSLQPPGVRKSASRAIAALKSRAEMSGSEAIFPCANLRTPERRQPNFMSFLTPSPDCVTPSEHMMMRSPARKSASHFLTSRSGQCEDAICSSLSGAISSVPLRWM